MGDFASDGERQPDSEYNISFGGHAEAREDNPYCKKGCTCGCHMMGDGHLSDPGEKCFMCGCIPKINQEKPEYNPFD